MNDVFIFTMTITNSKDLGHWNFRWSLNIDLREILRKGLMQHNSVGGNIRTEYIYADKLLLLFIYKKYLGCQLEQTHGALAFFFVYPIRKFE